MKKYWIGWVFFSFLGAGFVWADSATLWTRQTPGPSPTPLFKMGPNVALTPTTRPKRRHHDRRPRMLPVISGMAAYTPTPTPVPNATVTQTPTPDAN